MTMEDPNTARAESADAPALVHVGQATQLNVQASDHDSPNPKKLAVFCDGTWNDLKMRDLTNVARLAKCVLPTGVMDLGKDESMVVPQVVYYDEGVGVTDGVSTSVDALTSLLGGALGAGLDKKIEKAYRFIVLNYNAGDEIYLFGFSRGAYTARSLCGLIRKCGVLRRSNFEKVPDAIALYRDPSLPSESKARRFRQSYAHPEIAGSEDYTQKDFDEMARTRAKAKVNEEVAVVPDEIRRRGFHIRYLGVWDTVGEMGVPLRFGFISRLWNRKYRFHDERISSLVQSLRHAVAVDEVRKTFDVTRVDNIQTLNLEWAAGLEDVQVGDPSKPDYAPYERRPYQQRWFPGDHGAVGGGNPEPGLSSGALLWMAEGAEWAGLALDRSHGGELAEALRKQQPCANYLIDKGGSPKPPGRRDLMTVIGGEDRRRGPETLDEVHESARERWRRDPAYRPSSLTRFLGLPEMEPEAEPPGEAADAQARQKPN